MITKWVYKIEEEAEAASRLEAFFDKGRLPSSTFCVIDAE